MHAPFVKSDWVTYMTLMLDTKKEGRDDSFLLACRPTSTSDTLHGYAGDNTHIDPTTLEVLEHSSHQAQCVQITVP